MKNKSARKTRFGIVVSAASIMCVFANAALAGEITGNGKWIAGGPEEPLNGKSECAYSGRQDNYAEDVGVFRSMTVQAWGQMPKALRDFLTSIGVNPGISCNPTKAP
jgi:hypothetical protein